MNFSLHHVFFVSGSATSTCFQSVNIHFDKTQGKEKVTTVTKLHKKSHTLFKHLF